MPSAEPGVRELLERLPLPQSRDEFFAELDERLRVHDWSSARRWRLTATALAVVAVAVVAAAATVAATLGGGTVVNQTVSCPIESTVKLEAGARIPNRPIPSELSVRADFSPNNLLMIWTDPKGYLVSSGACRKSGAAVPLTQSGLRPDQVLHTGAYQGFSVQCLFSGHVLLHAQVHRSSSGEPTSALLAVWRDAKKPKPIAFFRWTPSVTRTYLSPTACRPYP